MPRLNELGPEAFKDQQQVRRALISELEGAGFSRYDMTPIGDERFINRSGQIKTVSFDCDDGCYKINS